MTEETKEIIYTKFGYGEIEEKSEESDLTKINLGWGTGFILNEEINKEITIHIKSFFKGKKEFTMTLDINTLIEEVKSLLLAEEFKNV